MTTRKTSVEQRLSRLSPAARAEIERRLMMLEPTLGDRNESSTVKLTAWVVRAHPTRESTNQVDPPWDDELRRFAKAHLASAQIPHRFVDVDSIPRTASGKIDRKRLTSEYRERAPRAVATAEQSSSSHSDAETRLLNIFRDVFSNESIVPSDNFIDLGGDSFLSIKLTMIARQQELILRPTDLLQRRSIHELATLSEPFTNQAIDADGPPVRSFDHEPSADLVRSGNGQGSLLFLHDISGQSGYANHLLEHIDPSLDVYVTSQPDQVPVETSWTIEKLARKYISDWTSQDDAGPYHIISFCWAGMLSYEIAKQLRADNRRVDLIGAIESGVPRAYRFATLPSKSVDWCRGAVLRFSARMRDLFAARSLRDLSLVIPGRIRARFRGRCALPPISDEVPDFKAWQLQNERAYYQYDLQPSDLTIDLFRIKETQAVGNDYVERTYGWKYLVGRNVVVHYVPGGHVSCTLPPHAASLAKAVNRAVQSKQPR